MQLHKCVVSYIFTIHNILPTYYIVKSLVYNNLIYCDVIFSVMTCDIELNVSKVYNTIHTFVIYIGNPKNYDSLSQSSQSIFGCSLEQYFDFRLAALIFKVIEQKLIT